MGVATAVAIGGLAISAGTTAMSFVQAGEQKSKQRKAEAEAAKAMAEARKKLEINFTDKMAIKKEPYELQREAMLSAGAQAIQAGVESERGAATMAGKVLMAQNEAQGGIRTAMGAEMTDIENKQIAEQSRLRDLGVQLDLGEAEGAQKAAGDAERAAAQSTSEGFQGLSSTLQQGLAMVPLFAKSGSAKAFGKIEEGAKAGGLSQQAFQDKVAGLSTQSGYGNLSSVGGMKGADFTDFMSGLPKDQLNNIYGSLFPKVN
jgi:type IV secretory pathway VirB10-like protein